jgi:integrase
MRHGSGPLADHGRGPLAQRASAGLQLGLLSA